MPHVAQYDQLDNPYRSTGTFDYAPLATETELRAFVGPRADYYLRKWAPKLEDPERDCGMNWAAFFLSGFWFAYRKMYAATLLLYGAAVVVTIVQQVVFVNLLGSTAVPAGVGLIINIVFALVCGLYGNAWYLGHTRRAIAAAEAQGLQGEDLLRDLSRRGGTSLAMSLGVVFLCTLGIFVLFFVLALFGFIIQG